MLYLYITLLINIEDMENNDNYIKYSWEQMEILLRKIANDIKQSDYKPDHIIGISRCGLVPATHFAYLLNIDSILTIRARTTPNDSILTKKNIEPIIEFLFPHNLLTCSNILLVDTVMASGTTIDLCLKKIRMFNPTEVRTAIIIDWPNSPYKIKKNVNRPRVDYIGGEVNKWPDFPWEH